jgi:outer membrane protein
MHMKNPSAGQSIIALSILAGVACPVAAQQAQPAQPPQPAQPTQPSVKVGFVNTERLLRDSAAARRAQKTLEVEIQKRDQEMRSLVAQMKKLEDALERSPTPLSEAERRSKGREFADLNRSFERKKVEHAEEITVRRNEVMGQLQEQANRAIRQVAEQENFDAVFQEAAYSSQRIDITDKVIKALEVGAKSAAK